MIYKKQESLLPPDLLQVPGSTMGGEIAKQEHYSFMPFLPENVHMFSIPSPVRIVAYLPAITLEE